MRNLWTPRTRLRVRTSEVPLLEGDSNRFWGAGESQILQLQKWSQGTGCVVVGKSHANSKHKSSPTYQNDGIIALKSTQISWMILISLFRINVRKSNVLSYKPVLVFLAKVPLLIWGIKPGWLEGPQQNYKLRKFYWEQSDILYLHQKQNIVAMARINAVVVGRTQWHSQAIQDALDLCRRPKVPPGFRAPFAAGNQTEEHKAARGAGPARTADLEGQTWCPQSHRLSTCKAYDDASPGSRARPASWFSTASNMSLMWSMLIFVGNGAWNYFSYQIPTVQMYFFTYWLVW